MAGRKAKRRGALPMPSPADVLHVSERLVGDPADYRNEKDDRHRVVEAVHRPASLRGLDVQHPNIPRP